MNYVEREPEINGGFTFADTQEGHFSRYVFSRRKHTKEEIDEIGCLSSQEQYEFFDEYWLRGGLSIAELACINRAVFLGLGRDEIEDIMRLRESSPNKEMAVNNMYYMVCSLAGTHEARKQGNGSLGM